MDSTVLVVDDEPANIDLLKGILQKDYRVLVAKNGDRAIQTAVDKKPDLVLLDIMMPGVDGMEVCRLMKRDPRTLKIPIIFVTAMNEIEDESKGFELGAVDYITKPVSAPIVKARVATHIALHDQKRTLEGAVAERTAELNQTRLQIVQRLGRAAEYKDNETGLHVIRMSHYSQILGKAAGLDEEQSELILHASPMHDIGKIGIPDHILLKPGKLDDAEWKIMRRHPAFGAEIIGEDHSDLLKVAREIALTHHEKWDGSGYPVGLKGEEIPLVGRIVAIADVFDALTSERPYKKAWPVEKAVELFKEEAGHHFDPNLIPLFLDNISEVLDIYEKFSEVQNREGFPR